MANHDPSVEQHQAALPLVEALHRAGFYQLLLESVKIYADGRDGSPSNDVRFHRLRVVLDEAEVSTERLGEILRIAVEQHAHASLVEIHGKSRLSLETVR